MTKRSWNKLGIETSLLGFGCMRFPTTPDGHVDEARAAEMIDTAYKAGVNYFDTAYFYHNSESEPVVGRLLSRYERDSFYLATKLPCYSVESVEHAQRIFEDQLSKLQTDHIDFYLLHALNGGSFQKMVDLGVIEFCEDLKRQGRIRYLGFSFHDSYDVFERILRYRDWDFCQIQYNYMDRDVQAGDRGVELARELDIPLVIMEPIKGGSLATLPDSITAPLKALRPDASVASWALRFVGTEPNVKVILSGMSTEDQVADNLKTFADFEPLSDVEMSTVEALANNLFARVNNSCTGCSYCMPCPAGVNIPQNFRIWNTYGIYENHGSTRWEWGQSIKPEEKASSCVGCGACEGICPQQLPIREHLARLQKELDALL